MAVLREIQRLEIRVVEETAHIGNPRGREEDVTARTAARTAEDGIEVVRHDDETRIEDAPIHVVIVIRAVGQRGLVVVHEIEHGEVTHPQLDVRVPADGLNILVRRRRVGIESEEQIRQVGPIILAAVGFLAIRAIKVSDRIRAPILESTFRATLVIHVAIAVFREVVASPFAVRRLDVGVGAIHGIAALRLIHAVKAKLHRMSVWRRQAGLERNGGAEHLRVGVIRIEVERGLIVPRPVRRNVELHRRRIPAEAAGSTTARRAVMTNLNIATLNGDKRHIPFSATACLISPRIQLGQIASPHHHPIDRLLAGVSLVIHLEHRIGILHEGATANIRRRRPGACIAQGIRSLHIEFRNRSVGLRRQYDAIDSVARCAVVVQTVVEHRHAGECRQGRRIPIPESHRQIGRAFVHEASENGDVIRRTWDGGKVRHVENHRREIRHGDGVDGAGRSLDHRTGSPVLPIAVR